MSGVRQEPPHTFQVDLGGIISLLSEHLYTQPGVFLRELLQNACDAIAARRHLDPEHQGHIRVELLNGQGAQPDCLIFEDDGAGLTEQEIRQFLATIGASSKRKALLERRKDFIGRFGIGLLSCFMVTDEVVFLTRSAKQDEPTWLWTGRRDGTYTLTQAAHPQEAPGTRVVLAARQSLQQAFDPEWIKDRLIHFGAFLPYPMTIEYTEPDGGQRVVQRLNAEPAPWVRTYATPQQRRTEMLAFAETWFGEPFLDVIPLQSTVGDVQGMAFVLARSAHFNARQRHRVYLKHMLLSETVNNLLPEWAFFVRCVINANALEPTASRESLCDDDTLAEVRNTLGESLKTYWKTLANAHPELLAHLMSLHGLSVKALALDDADFYRLTIDAITVETSLGAMTLGECRLSPPIQYVTSLETFRQMAPIACAQGLCLVNAAYTYDTELIECMPELLGVPIERFAAEDLPNRLQELSLVEKQQVYPFLDAAAEAVEPMGCILEAKKFSPAHVPVLLSQSDEALLMRSMEHTRTVSDALFAGLLDEVMGHHSHAAQTRLCLNFENAVIQQLSQCSERTVITRVIELLYVQALLLSHRPLHARELALLNRGLMGLIEHHIHVTIQ